MGAAVCDVPDVGALDLVAYAHASGTQDAPVGVEDVLRMGGVHFPVGRLVVESHVVHVRGHRHVLELAVPVHHAYGADVVALGEEQLDDRLAVRAQDRGVRFDLHVGCDGGGARGPQAMVLGDLDDAHPASAPHRQALQIAQGGDGDTEPASRLHDALVGEGLVLDPVERDGHGRSPLTHRRPPVPHRR